MFTLVIVCLTTENKRGLNFCYLALHFIVNIFPDLLNIINPKYDTISD